MPKVKINFLLLMSLLFLAGCDKYPQITVQTIKKDIIEIQNIFQGWQFDQEKINDIIVTILESEYQDDHAEIIVSVNGKASSTSENTHVNIRIILRLSYKQKNSQWHLVTAKTVHFEISN